MQKASSIPKSSEKENAEKPISLAPLTEAQALRGLLSVKPKKSDELKKASKKRTAKKAGER